MYSNGFVFNHHFSFTQKQVEAFAEITGDDNPVHLDEAYASKTIFQKRIIHGFLGASVFSKVFGTLFPGEGTIYLSQTMAFHRPMFTDKNYKATFVIDSIDTEKKRAVVNTVIYDEADKKIVTGQAVVMNDAFAAIS